MSGKFLLIVRGHVTLILSGELLRSAQSFGSVVPRVPRVNPLSPNSDLNLISPHNITH